MIHIYLTLNIEYQVFYPNMVPFFCSSCIEGTAQLQLKKGGWVSALRFETY